MTAGTTLASLGITSGDTITINDGTNTPFTYTSTGADTVGDLDHRDQRGENRWHTRCCAALNGSGHLVLTGTNGLASITVGGTSTADTAIGFGAGANSFEPTNLMTQRAVAQGQTLL